MAAYNALPIQKSPDGARWRNWGSARAFERRLTVRRARGAWRETSTFERRRAMARGAWRGRSAATAREYISLRVGL